jgi:hypothetical protein
MPSPRRQLEAHARSLGLVPDRAPRRAMFGDCPFGAGDLVRLKVDPRHEGRVRYVEGTMVRVQWECWTSENQADELELIR